MLHFSFLLSISLVSFPFTLHQGAIFIQPLCNFMCLRKFCCYSDLAVYCNNYNPSELRVFSDYSIYSQLFQISIIIRQVVPSASLQFQPKNQAVSLPILLLLYYTILYGLGKHFNYVACICSDVIDACFQHIFFPECKAYDWELISLFRTSAQSPVSFLLHISDPPNLKIPVFLHDFAILSFNFWTNRP